jgi:hypothetical protein
MTKPTIDANAISDRAEPLTQHPAHEIQPYGHLIKVPIALSGLLGWRPRLREDAIAATAESLIKFGIVGDGRS